MIDAVVTWVDGDDPAHEAKRLSHLDACLEDGVDRKGIRPTRFKQSGELWFCIRLIRRHAPWISRIFLVTDGQRPSWLTSSEQELLGVEVIDHTVLFRGIEDYLPVFSSRSIETLLFRIPGLADRFLYFNDDVFLIHPLAKSSYFADGKCLMRGKWQPGKSAGRKLLLEINGLLARHWPRSSFRDGYSGRRAERRLLDGDEYFALAHAPFPVSTPLMKEIIQDSDLLSNARFRFRNKNQVNPIAYMTHFGFSRGVVDRGNEDWEYVNCDSHSSRVIEARLKRCTSDSSIKSLCVQSMEAAHPSTKDMIESFLHQALES